MQYRCYFFGANGQLVGAETIVKENDVEATLEAQRRFVERVYVAGYELRQEGRAVDIREVKAS